MRIKAKMTRICPAVKNKLYVEITLKCQFKKIP